MLFNREFTFDRVVRLLLGTALIATLFFLLGHLRTVLTPFVIAVLLAYMVNPLVCRIQQRIPSRRTAVALSLLLVLAVLTGGILLVTPILSREFIALGDLLRQAANLQLPAWVQEHLPDNVWSRLVAWVSQPEFQEMFTPEKLWQMTETGLQKALPGAWQLLSGATSFLLGFMGIVIVLFYLIFLLMDYDHFQSAWPAMIPEDYRVPILDFLHEFADGMRLYFRGQSTIAAIVGVLFAIGFWLIDLPMGILLGLLIGVLNMIPYMQIVGAIPAFLLAVLGALVSGHSVWAALGLCALVFAVVQTLQDMVLTPRILGRRLGMSPVAILLSLSIWGRLLGMLGLLIALPMTCLLVALYRRHLVPSVSPPPAAPSSPPAAVDQVQ